MGASFFSAAWPLTQGLLPSVAVLGCGFALPVCGFVRTFD